MSIPTSTSTSRFASEDFRQVIHEMLHCGVGVAAVILVPVPDRNQEWAG